MDNEDAVVCTGKAIHGVCILGHYSKAVAAAPVAAHCLGESTHLFVPFIIHVDVGKDLVPGVVKVHC